MVVRAVIFDLGGVLVRTEDFSGRRKWEERLSLSEGELSAIVFDSDTAARATVGAVPESEVWRHVGLALDLNEREAAEMRRDFWGGDQLDSRLVEYLLSLRPRYRTAILSNAWSEARDIFVHVFGLGRVVDEMVISAEEGVAKPDERIYEIAAKRLGVRPEEAVFVDDMPENVEAARAAGLCGVLFRNTDQALAEVNRCLNRDSDAQTGPQAKQ